MEPSLMYIFASFKHVRSLGAMPASCACLTSCTPSALSVRLSLSLSLSLSRPLNHGCDVQLKETHRKESIREERKRSSVSGAWWGWGCVEEIF